MRTPKYSLETEQEVLETIMHFSDHNQPRVQKAMLKLNGDCFYNMDHRAIFSMIKEHFHKQEPFHFVDILVNIPKDDRGSELHQTLSWLIDNYGRCHAGESNFEHYVERLITLAKLRKQLALADQMVKDVHECPSPEQSQELLAASLTEIAGLSYRESKHGMSNIEVSEAFYDGKIVNEIKIPTMCDELNRALDGGIMPKSLIIVAAGASVGKTGFSIFLMDMIARAQAGTQCLFFSIEMEYKHIWMRHVGICAGKPFDKLNATEQMAAVTKAMMVPVMIYDTAICPAASDIDFILTTARLKAMEHPVSVIVIDYLTLVDTKMHFERNDLKQSYITGKLAQLAIELNCTVIALSQINRGAANRGVEDRCPWPHDAADSSGGHRSSSLWFGVDRPELYMEEPQYNNQFVVKCRKNRFGNTFDLMYGFNGGTFGKYIMARNFSSYAPRRSPEEQVFS